MALYSLELWLRILVPNHMLVHDSFDFKLIVDILYD